MKKALKRYLDATQDFYTLTGIKLDDMPKTKGKALGLDDLLANIEQLNLEYIARNKEYQEERNKCKKDIDKLENPIYRTIIEYTYLNFENNKEIAKSLKEYHNKDYTLGYLRILKSKAISKFEKMITKNNLI